MVYIVYNDWLVNIYIYFFLVLISISISFTQLYKHVVQIVEKFIKKVCIFVFFFWLFFLNFLLFLIRNTPKDTIIYEITNML